MAIGFLTVDLLVIVDFHTRIGVFVDPKLSGNISTVRTLRIFEEIYCSSSNPRTKSYTRLLHDLAVFRSPIHVRPLCFFRLSVYV